LRCRKGLARHFGLVGGRAKDARRRVALEFDHPAPVGFHHITLDGGKSSGQEADASCLGTLVLLWRPPGRLEALPMAGALFLTTP
jgi:hypothetical protein